MDFIQLQLKLVPDIVEIMQQRYKILHQISLLQPIGRRNLSQNVGLTERVLRAEVDFLKSQALVIVESTGIKLSNEGNKLLHEVYPYINKIFGINLLERQLQQLLNLPEVYVVPGDSDQDENVKRDMGKIAAQLLHANVKENDIITLTGGSTVAEVAHMVSETPRLNKVLFVPARGGIGQKHEYLANTIISKIAKKTGGKYLLLHVPDLLSDETYKSLINEDQVKETLEVIRNANILIHGIGDAMLMAKRRMVAEKTIQYLVERKAIGEAFGYYFAKDGEIVYKMNTIGVHLDDLDRIPKIIALAGGKSKADAILAVLKHSFRQTLVTDEGAAKEIIKRRTFS